MTSLTERPNKDLAYLTLGALGVVFGDIGTSPLYAMRECFNGPEGALVTVPHVMGVMSLIIWSLIIVVTIKYLTYVMNADNRGEGGVLALLALIRPQRRQPTNKVVPMLIHLGLFGTALLYGDGLITPAISVLGAVEGLNVATNFFESQIVPITLVILSLLFFAQRQGTGPLGRIFGPVIFVWFLVIGLLGLISIAQTPDVWSALDPLYGLQFLREEGRHAFLILGSVFLVVTGAEALYADMGHFGRLPIRIGWFSLVLPGLVLNYLGQGALLLREPTAVTNPFYLLAPSWGLYPLVILATLASIIASQALISGCFSLTRQAIQLGYLPRLQVSHTSSKYSGQIYVPPINLFLWFGTVLLVLMFRSSSHLAAAYGLAVSMTMVITVILTFYVSRMWWRWPVWLAIIVSSLFLVVDLGFFSANGLKIPAGGWVSLVVAGAFYLLMATWLEGQRLVAGIVKDRLVSLRDFVTGIQVEPVTKVPGTAIFMSRTTGVVPPALSHNLEHNKVLHQTTIILVVRTADMPFVESEERLEMEDLGEGIYQVTVRYGFMESPNIPSVVARIKNLLSCDLYDVTYFFGRETLLVSDPRGFSGFRRQLFAFLARNAQRATLFYRIPSDQVVEIGYQLEL